MNQKTMAIAAVLAATLALLLSTSLASPIKAVAEKINDNGDYDRDHNDRDEKDSKKSYPGDKSETNTEQTLKQKNTGSGA